MNAAPEASGVPEWTLADRLRKIRRHVGMSQADFAELLGVRPPTYSAWETGRNEPDRVVELAQHVEAVTGVSAAWTLGLDSRPSEPQSDRQVSRRVGRRGFMPIAATGRRRHPRRSVAVPLAAGTARVA